MTMWKDATDDVRLALPSIDVLALRLIVPVLLLDLVGQVLRDDLFREEHRHTDLYDTFFRTIVLDVQVFVHCPSLDHALREQRLDDLAEHTFVALSVINAVAVIRRDGGP